VKTKLAYCWKGEGVRVEKEVTDLLFQGSRRWGELLFLSSK